MTKRLTVVYEVPDIYDVTRITGTGELYVAKCSWSDAMRERDDALQRLAAAEAALLELWTSSRLSVISEETRNAIRAARAAGGRE
jgi:hypothetical protein